MLKMDVDIALVEVPVNTCPLISDTDFKTVDEAVAYNAAGMALYWHFTTTAGVTTVTAVTPTTGGDYDWSHKDHAMYVIEIPASGGASINNDTEGFGHFTGVVTGVLSWRGPTICFRAAALNNAFVTGNVVSLIDRVLDATEIRQASVNDAGATTTKFISSLTELQDDFWNRMAVLFTSGDDDGQMRRIKNYVGTSKEVTLQTPLDAAPANGDTFVVVAVRAFLTPDIEDLADAVWDEFKADHNAAGTFGEIAAEIALARKFLQNRKEFDLTVSKMYLWNDAGGAREYEATLTDNVGDPVTTATQGPINCSRWTAI